MFIMKKIVLFVLTLMLSASVFAQKKEVKAAEKALKKNDLTTAEASLKQAESLFDQADAKTKDRILFVKAQLAQQKGDEETAVKTYKELVDFEKQNGLSKYTKQAQDELINLGNSLLKKVDQANQNKEYEKAEKYMKLVYEISPSDDNLYILGVLQLYSKNYQAAYDNLKKLYDKGYDGVRTVYKLYDKDAQKDITVPDEKTMKFLAKTDQYENPRVEKTKSKRSELVTNMLFALNKLGKNDEAYQLIKKAQAEDPDNTDLIIGEANYYLKKGDNDKFADAMKRLYEKNPKPAYAYNIGFGYYKMGKQEEALKWFNKAIELDPNYKEAYMGASLAALAKERELVDQINENLNNPKKYDALMVQLNEVYRKALPYLEKYHELDPSDINTVRTLKKIYTSLDMTDKAKEMRALLKQMKQ